MSVFIIGDVHGNIILLDKLLKSVEFRYKKDDYIIFLGDVIDVGNSSKQCIERILQLEEKYSERIVCIMGNHEEWFLETKNDYTKHSWIISMQGLKTIESYSKKAYDYILEAMRKTGPELIMNNLPLPYDVFFDAMPKKHLKLIEEMKNYYEGESYICVHAGISIENIPLGKMDKRKMRWGFEGFPEKYKCDKLVVYGHYSKKAAFIDGKLKLYVKNNTVCLDTQSYGVLTSLILPESRILVAKEVLFGFPYTRRASGRRRANVCECNLYSG
jgi:serine/threonine protein phosphatase 1